VRLGYWWDSGILSSERPGRFRPPLWRLLKRFPADVFRMQSMLLAEWRGSFRGPSEWLWYLSDGGHFENTGVYELIRRRVQFVIVSDAGADPQYCWDDLGLLTQQIREDFAAEFKWIEPAKADPPDWIKAWIKPKSLTVPNGIKRKCESHACLGRITYADSKEVTWILLLKPSLNGDFTQDIQNYGRNEKAFPQQPTYDQIYDDVQWESYRALGEQLSDRVFQSPGA
jgi:hypothetical protein